MDKEKISQTLDAWNFWKRKIDTGIPRRFYLDQLIQLVNTPEVIALTGVRRCGKSTLFLQLIEHLINTGVPAQNTLYINFEEPIFEAYSSLPFLTEMFDAYKEFLNPQGKIFIFLDEIQLIDHWERFVTALHDRKEQVKICVTGSNSSLLQSEISTLLSGRLLSQHITPLTFSEYLTFIHLEKERPAASSLFFHLREYIRFGGFPRVVLEKDQINKMRLLREYYSSIVERDIISRNNIKNTREVKSLLLFLLSNIGNLVSTYTIERQLGISNENARRYFEYFQEAYLMDFVDLFSYKVKKQIYNPKKVYCVDTGLATVASFQFSENKGKFLENVVYQMLVKRYKDVFYWKNRVEVDFVTRNGYKIDDIYNVSWSLRQKETYKRELDGLSVAQQELKSKKSSLVFWEKTDDQLDKQLLPITKFLLAKP